MRPPRPPGLRLAASGSGLIRITWVMPNMAMAAWQFLRTILCEMHTTARLQRHHPPAEPEGVVAALGPVQSSPAAEAYPSLKIA